MSVLVMSEEAHATLAEVIRTVLDEGYNFFGFEAPQSLYDALDDCEFEDIRGCYSSAKIYRKLYTLNIKAYDNRYKIEEDDPIVPKMPDVPPLVQIRQYGSGHDHPRNWHYKLAKLLDCLIYQCSDKPTAVDPLYLALVDFDRVVKSFIVCSWLSQLHSKVIMFLYEAFTKIKFVHSLQCKKKLEWFILVS